MSKNQIQKMSSEFIAERYNELRQNFNSTLAIYFTRPTEENKKACDEAHEDLTAFGLIMWGPV